MKQYGDITQLHGYELDPVDLIVGGSPCQDLSVAGKRAGLEGERSGLFMEMIRIIKEMRNKTNGIYPRFTLWENVPGAFSSNSGRDFSAVLGEFARLIEPNAPDVPIPEGGWPRSGILLGTDWSIAWRTHDAQFWGVPQRRRRIALVMDLRGRTAWDILFEKVLSQCESLSGDPEKSGTEKTGSAGDAAKSAGIAGEPYMIEMTSTKNTVSQCGTRPTLTSRMGTGGNQVNAVFTLQAFGVDTESLTGSAAKQRDWKDATDLVVSEFEPIRRLTPLEVERLQGFPDRWTDIPGASDSARYRALGNSIALPFWEHLAHRFVEMGGVKTIGSLFDGIGGFPLVFKRAGAETAWTSEIEPFCQRVVEYHHERGEI